MKTTNQVRERTCPRCGKLYKAIPALSRLDGETLLCPDCGIREALDSLDIPKEEQEQILEAIHRSARPNEG